MAKVGQLCDRCNKGIVRLNEHNQPHCDNVRCKIPHLAFKEGFDLDSSAAVTAAGIGAGYGIVPGAK